MAVATIHMGTVVSGLTMHVRVVGMTAFRIRTWLGLRCLKLGAFIMGCGIEVSLDD